MLINNCPAAELTTFAPERRSRAQLVATKTLPELEKLKRSIDARATSNPATLPMPALRPAGVEPLSASTAPQLNWGDGALVTATANGAAAGPQFHGPTFAVNLPDGRPDLLSSGCALTLLSISVVR
jgi:hypothetical protein